jgi:hypothetical protein
MDGVEFIVEEGNEDDLAGTQGFWAWHQSGSWQSSWQANRKKEQRKQAQQQHEQQSRRGQQQQQKQRGRPKSEREELMDVLAQLDTDTIAGLKQVFGSRLQNLQSKEVGIRSMLIFDHLQCCRTAISLALRTMPFVDTLMSVRYTSITITRLWLLFGWGKFGWGKVRHGYLLSTC